MNQPAASSQYSPAADVVARTAGGRPMTLEEVSAELRCSEKTVKREIQRGRLTSARIGGRLMIFPMDFAAYLKRARKEA